MSGHSKWSTIKRQKGLADAKRGAVFTKIGNQIAIAARGGTDPALNSSLAMVIEKARAANMPQSNIQRAIDRVADKGAAQLEEITYEAYGPGGVGIIIETATDNRNRTFPEVRHALTKNGAQPAEPGSVSFQFDRKGIIRVEASGEDALLSVLDAGADDAIEEDGELVVYTVSGDLAKVRGAIAESGMRIVSAELGYVPKTLVPVAGEEAETKILKVLDAIDDLDDVTNVYSNADL